MPSEIIIDPVESATAAGLHYVTDQTPGIRRQRCGKGFTYLDPEGKRITDPKERQRIEALGIPPAYREVWICPDPQGHLQATGRDNKGRKQYRYHPRWRQVRNETKFNRMLDFAKALPLIRQRTQQDLGLPGLPREKVLATVVRLLEATLIRVGNPEYARDNNSFGLTILRDRHVEISGAEVKFQFRGKSGKQHEISIRDRLLARIVKRCRDIPGQELFQYLDAEGQRQTIGSGDVNEYLRQISGEDFTAKDFRTWAGTLQAIAHLKGDEPLQSAIQAKHNLTQMVKAVAQQLGNTPAVCRKYYIHPVVIETYEQGLLLEILHQVEAQTCVIQGLEPEETAAVHLLRYTLEQET